MMTFEQRHEGSHADIWGRRFPPHLKGERRHFIRYPGLNFNRLKQNKGSLRSRPESGTEIHSTWKANLCLICFRCYWNLKCLLYGRWLKPAGESDALEIQLQMKKQNNTEDGHDNGLAQNNWRLWAPLDEIKQLEANDAEPCRGKYSDKSSQGPKWKHNPLRDVLLWGNNLLIQEILAGHSSECL